ncbi:DeoR/GlpR family DNA-binding transcription regulator [Compostimonas suwonensis]|uniref:DeoR family transcriptional regulator of aga operon n=1 Tax=Compostimonas suwonensis TaxID=1048394 RepID=A0A2M9BVE1_9MICO|nr:DeoR/GlpR family DNA-binding transcription regulator [Compostimonas suwonensis]PJJ61919.1 DeoR family transcriptional regulator of aga operon [Compostimonas suwonensis]
MTDGEPRALPALLRRERMLALVTELGFVTVGDLSQALGVSPVTVRADLDVLDESNAVHRVHGGAVVGNRSLAREPSFEESLEASAAEKQAIGAAAAALVRSGNSVILDVGTTAAAVARALVARTELTDVAIITNGLNIALELEQAIPRFTVLVTGGTLRPRQHSLVNPLAQTMLRDIHADLAFLGCNGVDAARGVTNVNLPETEVKRMMLAAATRGVVVADSSKLGEVHLGRIGGIEEFATLVTGAGASAGVLDELGATGLEIVRAG